MSRTHIKQRDGQRSRDAIGVGLEQVSAGAAQVFGRVTKSVHELVGGGHAVMQIVDCAS